MATKFIMHLCDSRTRRRGCTFPSTSRINAKPRKCIARPMKTGSTHLKRLRNSLPRSVVFFPPLQTHNLVEEMHPKQWPFVCVGFVVLSCVAIFLFCCFPFLRNSYRIFTCHQQHNQVLPKQMSVWSETANRIIYEFRLVQTRLKSFFYKFRCVQRSGDVVKGNAIIFVRGAMRRLKLFVVIIQCSILVIHLIKRKFSLFN